MMDLSKLCVGEFDLERLKWKPQELRRVERPDPYPVDALPRIIRQAVQEVSDHVQAPVALICASALSAVSTAIQTRYSVQRDSHTFGPASLYLLTVAESGERKSTVDRKFTVAVREWEAKQGKAYAEERALYKEAMEDWEQDGLALKERLEHGIQADQLGGEFDPRVIHRMNMPIEPKLRTIMYGDDTPEAMAMALAKYPVAAIISAEAGVIFGSHGMSADSVTRNLAQANAMWDGDAIKQGRITRERITIEGMRVTMGLQVQPAVLRAFTDKTGGLARGIGYFARFLFCEPESTQGSRFYREPPADQPALRLFNERVTTMLDLPAQFDDLDRLVPYYVQLDDDAYAVWQRFHDEVEEKINYEDEYLGIKGEASKGAENAARLACCLHVFGGDPSLPITRMAMESACRLMRWYLDEAVRFAHARDTSVEVGHAEQLEAWLVREHKARNGAEVSVNDARQKGPGPLRVPGKVDVAVQLLEDHGRIRLYKPAGKKTIKIIICPKVIRAY